MTYARVTGIISVVVNFYFFFTWENFASYQWYSLRFLLFLLLQLVSGFLLLELPKRPKLLSIRKDGKTIILTRLIP